jgi:cytochrome c556
VLKDLSKCGWFKETKNGMERYQGNVWEEEQRQKDEKAPFLEKMKGVLAEIKSADMKYLGQID